MAKRQWLAKDVLLGAPFNKAAACVSCEMANAGVDYCLVGGLAVGHYSNPPVTLDIDFLVDLKIDALNDLAYDHFKDWNPGSIWFPIQHHRGLPDRGIKLKKYTSVKTQINLISTGKDTFLKAVVKRAVSVKITPNLFLPVITAEDLVIMKTLVGREKDTDDVDALYAARKELNRTFIDKQIAKLRSQKP